MFRPDLDKTVAYTDGSKGSHPHLWCDLMFKILMIQMLNIFSDERTEYLLNDHLSFMRFLGLDLSDRVPDAKTIRLFRELLTQAGAIERLFERSNPTLQDAGYLPMSGQILNATLVTPPSRLARQTGKAVPQGSSCTLGLEICQGKAACQKPIKTSWKNRALSQKSIAGSRTSNPRPSIFRNPISESRSSVLVSSIFC